MGRLTKMEESDRGEKLRGRGGGREGGGRER